MKKLMVVLAVLALTISAQATLIMTETFSYSDGPVTTVSAGVWTRFSGTADPSDAMISSGQLIINRSNTDDVRRDLGGDYSSGSVYVGFTLNLSVAPASEQYNFGFCNDANTFRDRLFVNAPGGGGGYRIGVGSASSGPIYWASDLTLSTTYQIVMRADLDGDTTYLWVNPVNEDSTSVSTNIASGTTVQNVFSRQTSSEGVSAVDNLVIATTFNEVIPEPGTMALMGLGLLGLILRRKFC